MDFQNGGQEHGKRPACSLEMKLKCQIDGCKKSPSVSASINGEICSRFSLAIKFAAGVMYTLLRSVSGFRSEIASIIPAQPIRFKTKPNRDHLVLISPRLALVMITVFE